MSLMKNALAVIDHVLADYQNPKVNEVVLKVGRLANCIPGALEFAFETLTREGACQGARLVLETEPVILKCEDCGQEFAARDFPWTCPGCESQAIQIVSGTEVYVANIDIDE